MEQFFVSAVGSIDLPLDNQRKLKKRRIPKAKPKVPDLSVPKRQQRRMKDKLTEYLDCGEKLLNPETEEEYNRREIRIVRDVMACLLGENDHKTPLDALAVED